METDLILFSTDQLLFMMPYTLRRTTSLQVMFWSSTNHAHHVVHTHASNLAANWDGIDDRESGLLAYTWCISSTTDYSCNILEQENPHGSVSEQAYWTNTGPG